MRICHGCGKAITTPDLRVKTTCNPECRRKVANERQANWKHENRERYLVVRRRWIENNRDSVRASERRHADKKQQEL
jgi:hypothetical protein